MDIAITPISESLISADHTSEGFLVPLSNGDILHIFRLDPGIAGNHVGNDGYIAKRLYSNGVWGENETVYNSNQYDDRNVHGGITNNGRIVVFFRRFEVSTYTTEGNYFIYSDDNAVTWSTLNLLDVSPKKEIVYGTGQMFYNPEINKYCIVGYINNYCEIRFSVDGSNWDERNVIAEGFLYSFSEIAGAYCGNGRMIVLERDDARDLGHPLIQMTSVDNGQTWTVATQTNIPPNSFWGCAPQLFWDETNDLLVAMTSDRRSYHGGLKSEESLYVYIGKPEDVFSDTEQWELKETIGRPIVNSGHDFYGYPTYAKLEDNRYLIVFSDRWLDGIGEGVNFYQFELWLNYAHPPLNPPLKPSERIGGVQVFSVQNNFLIRKKVVSVKRSNLVSETIFVTTS